LEALLGALTVLVQALAPLAPHVAEQLLIALGHEDGPDLAGPWPQTSRKKLSDDPASAIQAGS
jgi:leucyl-tRNA synthetase